MLEEIQVLTYTDADGTQVKLFEFLEDAQDERYYLMQEAYVYQCNDRGEATNPHATYDEMQEYVNKKTFLEINITAHTLAPRRLSSAEKK